MMLLSAACERCFGLKLDKHYYFVPFVGYINPAVQGIVINAHLNGQSQRPALAVSVIDLDDHEKMKRLIRLPQNTRSVGIIVTSEIYRAHEHALGSVELIPGFESLDPIVSHLNSTEGRELGPAFDALTDVQKCWTYRFPINKIEVTSSGQKLNTGMYWFDTIGIKRFEQSSCDIISVELLRQPKNWRGQEVNQEVNDDCVKQLLRVINYAHDCGGKKIVIINATGFSQTVAVVPRNTTYNVAAFFRFMARLQHIGQTASGAVPLADCGPV